MPNEYEKVIYFISSKSSSMNRGKFRINVEQIDNDCDRPLPTLSKSYKWSIRDFYNDHFLVTIFY